jgi:antitoxin component YwqK of YwqJK toxin-antitoxin module
MSNTLRVPFDDLVVADDQSMTWQDRPFTGIAYEADGAGNVTSEAEFVDGLQNGVSREWSGSGQLRSETEYFHGSRHGCSRTWHESGQLASEAQYQYSIKTEEKTWDAGGSLVGDWLLPENDEQRELINLLAKRFAGHRA